MKEDFQPPRKRALSAAVQAKANAQNAEDNEPAFVPPEQIAEQEAALENAPETSGTKVKKPRFKFDFTRKQLIIGGVIIALLLMGGTVYATKFRKKPVPPPPPAAKVVEAPKPVEPPKPTTEASKLTGVQVQPELNKLPVTGIMIENSPDARPQAGLKDAGVVYEAIAEGGITRFLALFQESQPDYVGPVRSVRPYYLDFLVPYDAAIAHAGGSGAALAQIRNEGIKDLDHGPNGGSFQRVNTRFAPHNLYTSLGQMTELQKQKGFSSTFTGFARKPTESASPTPNARVIDFSMSAFLYNPHFDYDPNNNNYKRTLAGKPHVDERSGGQISPKVVVALVMPHHYEGIYSVYGTAGSGPVYIFQDGVVLEGTWNKADRKTQLSFTDSAGAELKLNPGQTWVTLVSDTSRVSFTP